MKKTIILLPLIILFSLHSKSQNLVPNPSFEILDEELNCIAGDFSKMMNSWVNPAGFLEDGHVFGDPTIYASKTENWKCFPLYTYKNAIKPHSGYNYIRNVILVRYKVDYVIHNYIQVKLIEKLKKGQTYYAEFYIALIKINDEVTSFDNIGMYFTDSALTNPDPRVIPYFVGKPQITPSRMIKHYTWRRVSGTFVAESDYQYLTIGCFGPFDESRVETTPLYIKRSGYAKHKLTPMADYLLDDVFVAEYSAYKEYQGNKLLSTKIEVGNRINLENIYFDSGKSILLAESNQELDKLVLLLNKYPAMEIKIEGYTDNVGDSFENIKLSKERAKAVYAYLLSKEISQTRLSFVGYGERKPIDNNAHESGRSRNRRVEFVIVKK